jgi:hypothetical protein
MQTVKDFEDAPASVSHGCTLIGGAPESQRDSLCAVKVVVRYGTKTIKGYIESPVWTSIEELLSHAPHKAPEAIGIRLLDSDVVEQISLRDIKALFYVRSFDGDSTHTELTFHSQAPIIHGVWVRLQFIDGEIIEGIVYNSMRFLVDPGFFLVPTAPESNNKLVYVVKSSLSDHRILGLRKLGSGWDVPHGHSL